MQASICRDRQTGRQTSGKTGRLKRNRQTAAILTIRHRNIQTDRDTEFGSQTFKQATLR